MFALTMVLLVIALVLFVIYIIFRRVNNPYGLTTQDLRLVNAIIHKDYHAAREALRHGASSNAVDKKGTPALVLAAYQKQDKIVELLLEHHAGPNLGIPERRGEISGGTALIAASGNGSLPIVKKLLAQGAKINTTDSHGLSPLMAAASAGQARVVRRLLEKSADKDARDLNGYTPLMYAANNKHLEAAKVLLEYQADPNLRDNEGQTAYDFALQAQDPSLIKAIKRSMIASMDAGGPAPGDA